MYFLNVSVFMGMEKEIEGVGREGLYPETSLEMWKQAHLTHC